MMINGKWQDNVTCPKCKYRHPAAVTCVAARQAANQAAEEREAYREQFAEPEPADEVADLQRQLADAIRERDQYKAACELADALRPLGTVQVVEGGGAVLLDTSKGPT